MQYCEGERGARACEEEARGRRVRAREGSAWRERSRTVGAFARSHRMKIVRRLRQRGIVDVCEEAALISRRTRCRNCPRGGFFTLPLPGALVDGHGRGSRGIDFFRVRFCIFLHRFELRSHLVDLALQSFDLHRELRRVGAGIFGDPTGLVRCVDAKERGHSVPAASRSAFPFSTPWPRVPRRLRPAYDPASASWTWPSTQSALGTGRSFGSALT